MSMYEEEYIASSKRIILYAINKLMKKMQNNIHTQSDTLLSLIALAFSEQIY